MKVYKFRPPYRSGGRTSYPETKDRSGVYLIKEDGRLVYVGYSGSNLYRTMYRHFERWRHRSQEVVTYHNRRNAYTVRVVLCTPAQAARLERALIIRHRPRDNENKYEQYQLDFYDKAAVRTYDAAPVETVVPF